MNSREINNNKITTKQKVHTIRAYKRYTSSLTPVGERKEIVDQNGWVFAVQCYKTRKLNGASARL